MRFLIDECTGPAVARWLREAGHDVFSVYDDARGLDDDSILALAVSENRILITNDKDFGEKVYRDGVSHQGIVLLRLQDERPATKITVLRQLLENHSDQLAGSYVVATEKVVRLSAGD